MVIWTAANGIIVPPLMNDKDIPAIWIIWGCQKYAFWVFLFNNFDNTINV